MNCLRSKILLLATGLLTVFLVGFKPAAVEDGIYRSLSDADAITERELERFLNESPLVKNDSFLREDGVAHAFLRVQEEYGVSAVGLLAIASYESGYGMSKLATEKQNILGFMDPDDPGQVWDLSELSAEEAVYKVLSRFIKQYKEYDSLYALSNGTKPYSSADTWPYSIAKIRADFEEGLDLR